MDVPSVFLRRDNRPAGVDQDAILEDERRFAQPPLDVRPAILLQHVDGPVDLAARRVEHAQIAAGAERVDAIAFDRGRRTRAIAAIVAEPGAVRRFPQALAGGGIEGDHVLGAGAGAERDTAGRRRWQTTNSPRRRRSPARRAGAHRPARPSAARFRPTARRGLVPRHCGQSSTARFETAAGRAARRATVTRATDGRLRL